MGEEELIKKAISRDQGAMEALYDRYAPALLSLCYRYCGNQMDAEDMLHDGFLKIIGNIHKFRILNHGTLLNWMKRIMVNTTLNHLRERKKERIFIDLDSAEVISDSMASEEDLPPDLYQQLGQEKIHRLICDLPVGYRTVFNLYVFEEYGHREIADLLHISENTSKSQLSKARSLLRKKMNQLVNIQISVPYEKA